MSFICSTTMQIQKEKKKKRGEEKKKEEKKAFIAEVWV